MAATSPPGRTGVTSRHGELAQLAQDAKNFPGVLPNACRNVSMNALGFAQPHASDVLVTDVPAASRTSALVSLLLREPRLPACLLQPR